MIATTDRRETFATSPVELARAGGTIPSCDRVLLAFAMHLAARFDWSTARVGEFLAEPWDYQREWEKWLKEKQEQAA